MTNEFFYLSCNFICYRLICLESGLVDLVQSLELFIEDFLRSLRRTLMGNIFPEPRPVEKSLLRSINHIISEFFILPMVPRCCPLSPCADVPCCTLVSYNTQNSLLIHNSLYVALGFYSHANSAQVASPS